MSELVWLCDILGGLALAAMAGVTAWKERRRGAWRAHLVLCCLAGAGLGLALGVALGLVLR